MAGRAAEDLRLDERDLGDEGDRDDGAEHRQQPGVASNEGSCAGVSCGEPGARAADPREIATQLRVGERTVKSHVSAIFMKLGARQSSHSSVNSTPCCGA